MRHRAAALLLAALFVPASLRLAAAATAAEAGGAHCPLRCAHHGDAMAGGDCCPLAEASRTGCSLSKCSGEETPLVAPPLPGQPLILASIFRLTPPAPDRSPADSPIPQPGGETPLPPDHVPLLLS